VSLSLSNPQYVFLKGLNTKFRAYIGGFGCVAAGTMIQTVGGPLPVEAIVGPTLVLSWNANANRFEYALTGGAFPKGVSRLYRVTTTTGEFVASGHHRVFCVDGKYRRVDRLCVGDDLSSCVLDPELTTPEYIPSASHVNDRHSFERAAGLMGRYANAARRYGRQLLISKGAVEFLSPLSSGAQGFDPSAVPCDLQALERARIHQDQLFDQQRNSGLLLRVLRLVGALAGQILPFAFAHISENIQRLHLLLSRSATRHKETLVNQDHISLCHPTIKATIIKIERMKSKAAYYDMQVLDNNNYVCGDGFIHHNSGKTFVGCLDLLVFAGENPCVIQGYFAPTYSDIRDTFWPTLDEAAELMGFSLKINRSNFEVTILRGGIYYGTIICRSMDRPETIKGFKIARALVDEIDVMPIDKAQLAWNKIVARMRLVVKGVTNGVGVTTTPEGFRFVYDRFSLKRGPSYSMVQAGTIENEEYLPDDYISSLEETYSAELVRAYLMGDFVNLTSGTVYRNYDRVKHRSTETIRDKEPLHIGQDFNVGNMASAILVQRPNGWHCVGEIMGALDTPELLNIVENKYSDHKIIFYPDASGKSRKSNDASKTDISLMKAAGHTVKAKPSNPPVKDRILSVNTAYAKGMLWINDVEAPTVAAAQEQQAYSKNGEPDKTTGHDHPNDGLGYLVHWTMPVNKPRIVGL